MIPFPLSAFDWVLLALLLYSTVRAFLHGLLLEIFALVGLLAGLLLACWNYKTLAAVLNRWISSLSTAQVVSFLLIAIGTIILCSIVGRLFHRGAKAIGLGFLDRLLGAVFGFARGCLLCGALMMVLVAFGPLPDWIANSHLAPYFLVGAHGVSFVVPHEFGQHVSEGALQLKHSVPGWIKQWQ